MKSWGGVEVAGGGSAAETADDAMSKVSAMRRMR